MTITIHKPHHKLISENGAVLWLPSSVVGGRGQMGTPDIYTQSSTQLYPLATKLEYADGRVFRYGKHGATSTQPPMARMVVNANLCPGATGDPDVDGYEGDPYIAAAAGTSQVDLEIATAYAENFFEDGMLAVYPTGHYNCYRISGSELGDGTYCRVYLDEPLKTALTATTGVTAYKSRFSQLKVAGAEGSSYASAVGVSQASVFTADYFSWIQTRGPCIITPTVYFGDSANERLCMLVPANGTMGTAASYDPSSGHQVVGYLLSRTESNYGDLWVMLMLE